MKYHNIYYKLPEHLQAYFNIVEDIKKYRESVSLNTEASREVRKAAQSETRYKRSIPALPQPRPPPLPSLSSRNYLMGLYLQPASNASNLRAIQPVVISNTITMPIMNHPSMLYSIPRPPSMPNMLCETPASLHSVPSFNGFNIATGSTSKKRKSANSSLPLVPKKSRSKRTCSLCKQVYNGNNNVKHCQNMCGLCQTVECPGRHGGPSCINS
jgi:hypothetical protein